MKKKLFVVSDIHGYYSLLKEALDKSGYDPQNEEHLLVCCGDYFDRGTENAKVLSFIDRIKNKVLLKGNHEDMLIEIFDTGRLKEHNFINGTDNTIREFFGKYSLDNTTGEIDFSGNTRTLDRITELIGEMKNCFETEHFVFTHGWLPTVRHYEGYLIDKAWRRASEAEWKKARWSGWRDMYRKCDHLLDKTIVCGHIPSFFGYMFDNSRAPSDSSIFYGDGVTAIDGGTYTSGRVNVLVIEDEIIEEQHA